MIHPTAIIEENVTLGENCIIDAYAVIKKNTVLGNNVHVHSFAVVGDLPQVRNFDANIRSGVSVGAHTIIREGVTIHRSTQDNSYTAIGQHCFLMANSHVAHDCILGDFIQLTNGVLLGGHVKVASYANLGGNAVVHQHLNLGEGIMIAGRAALNLDIPPFLLVSEHNCVHGLNLVGLKRRGFNLDDISELKSCYKKVLCTPGNPYENAKDLTANTVPAKIFLAFFNNKGAKGCVQSRHIQAIK